MFRSLDSCPIGLSDERDVLMSMTGAVIDLAAYRRRRDERNRINTASGDGTPAGYVPVFVVPVWVVLPVVMLPAPARAYGS